MRRVARWLFTLCSAVSLLLCVAVCVLWTRSLWVQDEFTSVYQPAWVRHSHPKVVRWDARSAGGYAQASFTDTTHVGAGSLSTGSLVRSRASTPLPPAGATATPAPWTGHVVLSVAGLTFARRHDEAAKQRFSHYSLVRGWFVSVPYWTAVLLTGMPAATGFYYGARRRRARRWAQTGRCPRCGYDLRATPGRCPECGTPAAVPAPE